MTSAAVARKPDAFGVVFAKVPVTDMLRYQHFTMGNSWIAEYGVSDKACDIRNILKYSPLHNLKKAKYPAILVATADNDDRVVPMHSYKFVATLQEKAE